MKVRKLVNSILTFGMVLILFITLPMFEQKAYAANALEAKLNVSSAEIVKGKSFSLRVYNLKSSQTVVFNSSRPGVASVDSSGVILARDNGNATISARIFEAGKIVTTLACSVKVGPPAQGVLISSYNLDLMVGDQARLTHLLFPINTVETPVYTSKDESIASVSPGGRVTGEGAGQTSIYCIISKGFATCEVTVHPTEEAKPAAETTEVKENVEAPQSDAVEPTIAEEPDEQPDEQQTDAEPEAPVETAVPEDDQLN
jgi:hypothetical protein